MLKKTLAAPLALALTFTLAEPSALAVKAPLGRISSGGLEAAPGIAPLRREATVSYSDIPRGRKAAWDHFLADAGGGLWQALWDSSTGVPLRVFGRGIPAPGALQDDAAAERHARAFIERYADLIAPGVPLGNLKLAANRVDNGMRSVSFYQRAPLAGSTTGEEVPVIHGQLSFRFKNDRLFVIASEVMPSARAAQPRVSASDAAKQATAWMTDISPTITVAAGPELCVLPLLRERGATAVTAWRVSVRAGALDMPYDVYIDAQSGRPVARDMLGRFAQGTVAFDVPERSPQGARIMRAPRFLDVAVNGAAAVTDAAGVFSWSGTPTASVDLTVQGAETVVHTGVGSEATANFNVADAGQAAWSMADDQYGDAQLSALIHASIVKQHALKFAPDMAFLFGTLTANVNQTQKDYQCNAFWNGATVNFAVQSGPCNNTGRLADVIYHEFGHAVHQHARVAGMGLADPALGEGQSDYLACSTTGDGTLAPGFFLNGAPLRRCENDRRWPGDIDADPHETGLIFTGAMWDLRTKFIETYGQDEGAARVDLLYYGAIQRASNVPSTYAEVIAADDDDGDLSNGTPNICAINEAFVAHGLSPYIAAGGLLIHHEVLSAVPFTPDPIAVKVTTEALFPQCGQGDVDKITLLWGPTSAVNKVTMAKDASGYVASLPPQADGGSLRYRIMTVAGGQQRFLPDNPADTDYHVFVGDVVPLYCNDFETGIDGWEFSSLSGGVGDFKWDLPQGLAEDPSEAHSGEMALGNDLSANGIYAPKKTTYADSPTVDLAGNARVRLQLWRWLAVQDGAYDQATINVNGKTIWENEATGQSFGQLNHIDSEWRFQDFDLSWIPSGGGSTAQVQFALSSDGYYELGGWTIDDFCIVAWKPQVTDTGAGGAGGGDATGGGGGSDGVSVVDEGCNCEAAGSGRGGAEGASGLLLAGLSLALAARRRGRACPK